MVSQYMKCLSFYKVLKMSDNEVYGEEFTIIVSSVAKSLREKYKIGFNKYYCQQIVEVLPQQQN